jgi:aspartyl-tRNA(Asn)/glutamyl-tRNA(Gln) amidotransferase subunit A
LKVQDPEDHGQRRISECALHERIDEGDFGQGVRSQRAASGRLSRRAFVQSAAAAVTVVAAERLLPAQPRAARPSADELARMTLRQASEALRSRRASSRELTEACLARIKAYQGSLNAFITIAGDQARARARAMDDELAAGKSRGPLHGVPISLKDNIDTAGIRTTGASALFADRVPTEDAQVVKQLLAAGVVILGKTNLDEFAAGGSTTTTYFGPAHNPWRLDRSTGGSSGGSGAAVAAQLCYGSIGTDTGGSVRIPSSCCGVVGLKPTYGRVSTRGVIPFILTRDHVGPIGRTVEDVALLLQAIAGYDAADTTSEDVPVPDFLAGMQAPVAGLRLGIVRTNFFDKLDPEVAAAVEVAIGTLGKLVASTREVEVPATNAVPNLGMAETYAYHAPWFTRTPNLYQGTLRRRLEAAAKITAADYHVDLRETARLRRAIREVFRDVDLLVTPTLKIPARTIADAIARAESEKPLAPEIGNTAAFNVFGLPTITVPCGFTRLGLPIGLQISGPHFQEGRVLALARTYEQATSWHDRHPDPPHAG